MVDTETKRKIRRQRFFGRVALVVLLPLAVAAMGLAGYRIRNLKQVRKRIRRLTGGHDGPWLICANHLTLIDSAILIYAMAPIWGYFADYRRFPWNLPEKRNFKRNWVLAAFCYLAKCIHVERCGAREQVRETMQKCIGLLEDGDSLLIFPEGTRSRSGRVEQDAYPYGVGRFLRLVPDCKVLLLYLRGDGQESYSNFPRFGERFVMEAAVLEPSTDKRGLRADKEYAGQIIGKLGQMEASYFASRRKRRGRLGRQRCGIPVEG